ncbi:hypothetical protein J36TS2_34280 [Bacillus paralicheniformis]|jgi:hypothetical protein|nr:hypothetical protein J23TS8_11670 [Bacillus paralicheniformis]GIN54534.1 hypothetical protein J36TS2_34280 [Bacillus paralicheniformis]
MSGTALLSRMIEEEVGTTPLFFEEYQWIGRRRGAADGPFSQEKYSSGLNYIPIVNNEERDSGGNLDGICTLGSRTDDRVCSFISDDENSGENPICPNYAV